MPVSKWIFSWVPQNVLQRPVLSTSNLHLSCRKSPNTRKMFISGLKRCCCQSFAQPTKPLVQLLLVNNQLHNFQARRKHLGHFQRSRGPCTSLQIVTLTPYSSLSLLNSYPLLPTFHFSKQINSTAKKYNIFLCWRPGPLVRTRPNFLIKSAHSFSFNLIQTHVWKQANCLQNLVSPGKYYENLWAHDAFHFASSFKIEADN